MIFDKLSAKFHNVLTLMRIYYFILLALFNQYGANQLHLRLESLKPVYLFPIGFFIGSNHLAVCIGVTAVSMAAALVAALMPNRKEARIFAFLALFLFNALYNSTGSITHLWAFWLWSSLVLALVPTIQSVDLASTSRTDKMLYLLGWWSAQTIVLFFYFLSGFWKLVGVVVQFAKGEPNFLSSSGLAYHLASEIVRAGVNPLFKSLIFDQPGVGQFLAASAMILQLGCLPFIFLTHHRPLIGVALLCFHVGTSLVLGVSYPMNFMLIGVLFVGDALPGRKIPQF